MITILGLLWACGTEEKTQDTAEETASSWVEYYSAETVITLESSGMQFDEGYAVRRTLDPASSEIFEELYSTIDGTLVTVTLTVDQEAKTFTLDFSDEAYTGEGTFEGTGLDWTSWASTSYHSDGTFVTSEDQKDDTGIHTTKVGYGMDNAVEWRLNEDLTPITAEEFQAQLDELGIE